MESRISLFFARLILMLQRILFFLLSLSHSQRSTTTLHHNMFSSQLWDSRSMAMAFKWKSRAVKGAARSVVRGISWIWKLKLFFSPPPPPPRTLYYENDDDDDAEWWENNFSRFRCVLLFAALSWLCEQSNREGAWRRRWRGSTEQRRKFKLLEKRFFFVSPPIYII